MSVENIKKFTIKCSTSEEIDDVFKSLSFGNSSFDKFLNTFLSVDSLGGLDALKYFAVVKDFDLEKKYNNYIKYASDFPNLKEVGVKLTNFPMLLVDFLNNTFGHCVSYLEKVRLEDITKLIMEGTPVALTLKDKDGSVDYVIITGVEIKKTDKKNANGDSVWEPAVFYTIDSKALQIENIYPLVKPYSKNYKSIIVFEDFLYF